MVYVISESIPSMESYKTLHQTTGWNAKGLYTYDQLYQAITNSWYSASIYVNETLIGYGRIISDGIYQTLSSFSRCRKYLLNEDKASGGCHGFSKE